MRLKIDILANIGHYNNNTIAYYTTIYISILYTSCLRLGIGSLREPFDQIWIVFRSFNACRNSLKSGAFFLIVSSNFEAICAFVTWNFLIEIAALQLTSSTTRTKSFFYFRSDYTSIEFCETRKVWVKSRSSATYSKIIILIRPI